MKNVEDVLFGPSDFDRFMHESDEGEEVELSTRRRRKKRMPVYWNGVRLARKPTTFEVRVLSLTDIPVRLTREIDEAVLALQGVRQDQLAAWVSGNSDNVPTSTSPESLRILTELQRRVGRYGAYEVRRECQRQGLHLTVPTDDADAAFDPIGTEIAGTPLLAQSAALMADRLERTWWSEVASGYMRLRRVHHRPKRADLVTLLEARSVDGLRSGVRRVMHEAFAMGRLYEIRRITQFDLRVVKRGDRWCVVSKDGSKTIGCHETKQEAEAQLAAMEIAKHVSDRVELKDIDEDVAEAMVDYVIQTAVLDANTCDPCEDADGKVFEYDSDEQIEYAPPYFRCKGDDNCRCVQIYVLKGGGSWAVREEEIVAE